ncbi:Ig-like domain-containing protein [Riemerella anatipestifer]|uniref:Ig-like domain-containing protein n=1 Tax=Riemerella anatipestifer TaxID=34085 RepID=UPI0030BDC2A6
MRHFYIIILSILSVNIFSQNSSKIFVSDIDRFWVAYDSIRSTNDYQKKLDFINEIYIKKGTKGLHAFMKARDYNDTLYVKLIDEYPKFWASIKPNTLEIKNKIAQLNSAVENLKKLYPKLKNAEMYFAIGGLRSGGTIMDNMVLVGAEIATGNSAIDTSEFKDNWLKNIFAKQSLDNIVYINIHEYIHTQQNGYGKNVLSKSIAEGACDFISELVLENPVQTQYMAYGKLNEKEIKKQFKKEMFSENIANWLYNGSQKGEQADLGYYIGYEICKSYYNNLADKSRAIEDIIEINYSNDFAVEDFLFKSKFFKGKINKGKIIKEYRKNQPYIVKVEPFENKTENVNSNLKELKITFSKEMNTKKISIRYSEKGKDYFPITKVKGYENNDKTLVLILDLKPSKEYEFIITNDSFVSKDGYALIEEKYLVKFKTK